MVKTPASSSSSPVTITVSSAGKSNGSRSMGLTSPVPRASLSNNPNSPLRNRGNRASIGGNNNNSCSISKDNDVVEDIISSEYLSYTVLIPPTPEHHTFSSSQTSLPEDVKSLGNLDRSYISGTMFTGGFNSVTRGHVLECSMEKEEPRKQSGLFCGMKGCDEEAIKDKSCDGGGPCECGFKICRECYLECAGNGGGRCPGCKESFKYVSDDEEGQISEEEEEDQALPLRSMAEFKGDKRLSVVKSYKAPNHPPPDFDHTRWLFETKGTYGYGNAVWPKDGFGKESGANGFENPPDFAEKTRKPLTRKVSVSAAILSPYR